ncbi:MAG: TMEM175 family protein [Synechococcus sp.]|nr:TMEM175 family protein [Synechococcus sp.]
MNGPPLMNSRPAGGDREREQTLNSGEILPFFDAIFAVAFTLLATSVPDRLIEGMDDVAGLMLAISAFLLNGITVLLYWFKLRRLLVVARVVHPSQMALILVSLVSIVVLPRLSALAFLYGDGQGNLFAWSASQVANMVFLGVLFLFDGICLLFALSLRRHRHRRSHTDRELDTAIQAQRLGFGALLILAALELLFTWFNNEYVLLVPLVLLAEELLVARRFATLSR